MRARMRIPARMRIRARVAVPVLALAAGAGAGVLPAMAADQSVSAKNFAFTPKSVAVQPGDTVTFTNDDGAIAHSLKFDDETSPRQQPGTGWTVTRTFTAGEERDQPYRFHCTVHLSMEGFVYVNATGTVPAPTPTPEPTPSATPTPTPTATPSPTPTAAGGGGGSGGGGSGAGGGGAGATPAQPAAGAKLRSLKLLRARRAGLTLRIDLSAPADVRGALRRRAPGKRRFAAYATLRFGRVAAGPRTLRSARRLSPGRYRLKVTAAGTARTLAFAVKR